MRSFHETYVEGPDPQHDASDWLQEHLGGNFQKAWSNPMKTPFDKPADLWWSQEQDAGDLPDASLATPRRTHCRTCIACSRSATAWARSDQGQGSQPLEQLLRAPVPVHKYVQGTPVQ
jgi:hypothetical protein